MQGADLTNVTFAGGWLRQVDLSGARMNGVWFGELPFLMEDDAISVCAYSPDGKMLAVGVKCGLFVIYDTTNRDRAYQRSDDGGRISCVAFSPNNQQLIYGKSDGIVHLWNFANNNTGLDMKGHGQSKVNSVAFSPCGKQFATASHDMTVRLWSSETGKCVFVLEGHTDVVAGVAYCVDGQRLVSGSSNDGTVRLWDSQTGGPVACWNIAHEEQSTLAFSANGQWVAIAFEDKIQIMNTVTGKPGPVLNNNGRRSCIAFSSNDQWIVTSSTHDDTLRLWDFSSGLLISSYSGHTHCIVTCNFSPSSCQIASGDLVGFVRLWEVDTSRAILESDRPTIMVLTVTYSPDGRSILSDSDGQGVQQWDSRTVASTSLLPKIFENVECSTFSPDGNQIATGHENGTIQLWNRQTGTAECTLLGHTKYVTHLAYSPCGRWIVSDGSEGVRLWDLHTNEHLGVIAQTDKYRYDSIAFTPTGQIVLSARSRTLRLHDPRAQDPCAALKEISMDFEVSSLDCSPDGQELAIGSLDGTVYLWDFQPDKHCIELKGHGKEVGSVHTTTASCDVPQQSTCAGATFPDSDNLAAS